MIRFFRPFAAMGAAVLLLAACTRDAAVDAQPFAVRFSLASVPENLTLDSLDVNIDLGNAGRPQALGVDLKTGTSHGEVQGYPGQAYKLSYRLFASGFEIGAGEAEGVLSENMEIELHPAWNPARIESARSARKSGKLLPAWLESSFDKALAGRDLGIRLDSAAGHAYTWYIRAGSAMAASGAGTRVGYAPPDSLAGRILNIKLVVKLGDRVIEERDWDVKVLADLPRALPIGIIAKSDTGSPAGGYARYRYDAAGRIDSILYYDTTVFVPGREPVGSLAYSYPPASLHPWDRIRVVRAAVNEGAIDSAFSYDPQGRLLAVTVASPGGAAADSLEYPDETTSTLASYAQGKLTRLVKHVLEGRDAEVDSIWSPGDSGLVLTGRIAYAKADGQVVNLRVYRKFGGELLPYRSEWTLYNALGLPAFRNHYEEGPALQLDKTETYAYRPDGRLDRIFHRDEITGEIARGEWFVYPGDGERGPALPKVSARPGAIRSEALPGAVPASGRDQGWPGRLAVVNRYFPSSRMSR